MSRPLCIQPGWVTVKDFAVKYYHYPDGSRNSKTKRDVINAIIKKKHFQHTCIIGYIGKVRYVHENKLCEFLEIPYKLLPIL